MNAGGDRSPPLSETKRYNGVVAKVKRKKYHHKDGKRGERVNCELTRDDAGEQERLIFAALEQSLPAAKVGMKVSFNVRPWKNAGSWDYEAVNVTMFGHAPKKDPPPPEPVSGKRRRRGGRRKAEKAEPELTVPQLKAKCKELGISGYSKLRKAELVSKLEKAPEPKGPTEETGVERVASSSSSKKANRNRWETEDGFVWVATYWEGKEEGEEPPVGPFNSTDMPMTIRYYGGKNANKKKSLNFPSWGKMVAEKGGLGFHRHKDYWEESAQYFIRDYDDRIGEIIEEDATFEGFFIFEMMPGFSGLGYCEKFDSPIYFSHDDEWLGGSIKWENRVSFGGVKIGLHPLSGGVQFQATAWKSKTTRRKDPMAFAVTLNDIEKNEVIKREFTAHLEKDGLALVVPFVYDRQAGTGLKQRLKRIGDELPGFHCTMLEPTELVKKENELIIDQVSPCLAIHRGKKLDGKEKESCKLGMCRIAYESQVARRGKNEWIILGDETGSSDQWIGKEGRQTAMMWVAVPPGVNLPVCHPNFHMMDVEFWKDETAFMWGELASKKEVRCYFFPHEQGIHPRSRLQRIGLDKAPPAILEMSRLTLPLVLENIVSIAEEGSKLQIYVERIGTKRALLPGTTALDTTIQEIEHYYELRGHRIEIPDPLVIPKEPLDHAWLGYADLIGHIDDEVMIESTREDMERVRERVIHVPFRYDTLNLRITGLIKDSAYPLDFLKSLAEIPAEDMKDYVVPFLTGTTHEALSKLGAGEWQDLLTHLLGTSPETANSSKYIFRLMDFDEAFAKQTRPVEKYNFLRAMIGLANHFGYAKEARGYYKRIVRMKERGELEIPLEDEKKLRALRGGAGDNAFDFTHINRGWEYEVQVHARMPITLAYYLGAQAHARALRGGDGDLVQALDIENRLREREDKIGASDNIRRRYVYFAEMLMDKMREKGDQGPLKLAYDMLSTDPESGLMKVVGKSRDWDWCFKEPNFRAAFLKCCALMGREEGEFREYSAEAINLLNDFHPSQRIAYWCARWASEIGLADDPVAEKCCNHLVGLAEEAWSSGDDSNMWRADAAGVILACELRDLDSRGMIGFDSKGFYDYVRSKSEQSTKDWLSENPPRKEDWLKPLNFNYR